MKIALIGYGKMGKTIEKIALERGHEIVSTIDIDNIADFDSPAFKSADVAIEFTQPACAADNIRSCFKAKVPVVCGTTGWSNQLDAIITEMKQTDGTLFWSSNFSLGVNVFFAVNKYLAKIMDRFENYNVQMTEIHHTKKLDAPSGTAITLAEGILENLTRKTSWCNETESKASELAIKAIREGEVPGTHTIIYENEIDSITITHEAKNRHGFAFGSVVAAEFTAGKKGYLGMKNMLDFLND